MRKKEYIPFLVITSVFIFLLKVSWLKWGSIVIDTGRELYVPWRILSGDILYRDVLYQYGPFSPYFNAFLCSIFGVHINALIISGALTTALLSFLVYKISRIFLNPLLSTFSVLTFLFVFAFGQYYEAGIFNFIIPYTYAATHGITLAAAALFFYYHTLDRKKPIYSYALALFTILTLLTRLEIGAMLVISLFTGALLASKNRLKDIALHCLFPIITAGFIYAIFSSTGDTDLFLKNLDLSAPFTAGLMGTDDLFFNIASILKIILYYLAISTLLFSAGSILSKNKNLVAIPLALAVIAVAVFVQVRFFPYYMQYRCAPLICISLCVIAYKNYLRTRDKKFLFLMVFSVFSILLLARILFKTWAGQYGFYLLVPGMLCYYVFFLKIIPEMSTNRISQRFYRLGFVIVSIAFIVSHASISAYAYKNRALKISTGKGNIFVYPAYHRVKELLNYLIYNTGPSDSLVVFPEGLTLNFLAERKNPVYKFTYFPVDFAETGFEKEVIDTLEEKEVAYVAILPRDTSEYGAARFGIDYAHEIPRYLEKNYTIEKQFGPMPFTSDEFSAVLLKRKDRR